MCSNLDKNIVAKYGASKNMLSLEKEIKKLECLNYSITHSIGYGTHIYMVRVTMIHEVFGSVELSIAQCEDDSTLGYVRFTAKNSLMNSYQFEA